MKIYLSLFLCCCFILTSLSSCKYSTHDKTYAYSNEWEIDYPSFLRKSRHVYPGSELQLANGYRDTYIFVREVITTKNQTALTDSLANQLMTNLEDPKKLSDSTYVMNGATFRTVELTGLLNDMRMYYLLSVIQSDDKLFQYTGWMFNHKRDLWEEDYFRMLHSWHRTGASSNAAS